MGMIGNLFRIVFGGGRNVVAETAGVFRTNTEAEAQRTADYAKAALAQYGAEFQVERKGGFDRFMDGLNRLPRPALVIATLALFASAMFAPIWFAVRMQGLALVPEPLWWLAGTIVTFYFGGRFQIKSQEFRRAVAETVTLVPEVIEHVEQLEELRHDSPGVAADNSAPEAPLETGNAAVRLWREEQHDG